MASSLGLVFGIEAEVHQRVVAFAGLHDDITAFAPVTARRSPAWNELLAPEGDTAVAAISGFNANFGFINEHRFEPWAVSASRSALTRPASSLLRIWRNQPDFIRL